MNDDKLEIQISPEIYEWAKDTAQALDVETKSVIDFLFINGMRHYTAWQNSILFYQEGHADTDYRLAEIDKIERKMGLENIRDLIMGAPVIDSGDEEE